MNETRRVRKVDIVKRQYDSVGDPPIKDRGKAVSHVTADQSEIFAFLADPDTHGIREPVVRIDTHGAAVFLAGPDVYKVKRAVRFPFMDYGTLEKRRAACEAEVAVNRPNAPDLYLGVVPITRSGGTLSLGGSGEAVEWAVHLRRFDEAKTLDHVAAAGGLSPTIVASLARAVVASHARAPLRDGGPATASLARYLDQNEEAFRENPELFPPERAGALTSAARQTFARLEKLLLARGEAGFVRRLHGDLHLRNIVLIDGEPTLFDAIEFDDAIATGDVLYDLAFLLMDLWERDLRREANQNFNRYLWESDEAHLAGLAAMPIFLSIRAAIRAKVIAAGLAHLDGADREQQEQEARRYFAFAESFLDPAPPRLVAVGGLSGTGKSTVSAALAPHCGAAPGAVHLRSDIERKRLFGVPEHERLPGEAYEPAVSERVHAALHRKAALALRAGHSVIIDAVQAREDERTDTEAVAVALGVPFSGFWLEAPLPVLLDRVARRTGDASDADADVVRRQMHYEVGAMQWRRLDATVGADALVREILASLD
jgi:aminoglycoside phosphotransferase family enzyme/predicted kinase